MTSSRDARGALHFGGVRLADLAADPRFPTPSYVYDLEGMTREAEDLAAGFDAKPHLIAYAVKANSAAPIVRALAAVGCGADVVSGGELQVALGCGVVPDKIVYSGVAKTDGELDLALGTGPAGIGAIQIESIEEVARVAARARALGRRGRVSLRINPAVDLAELDTHHHIATGHDEAKFGVPRTDVGEALAALRAEGNLDLMGLTCHVGSQFTAVEPYVLAARVVFDLAREVRASGVALRYVDPGGGFGIDYGAGCPVRPADFVRAARAELRARGLDDLALYCEPGRSLVAAHGVLLATVLQTKTERNPPAGREPRRWLLIDAGMNDLLRPALYQAVHRVVPLESTGHDGVTKVRVVGPVCESSDDFGEHAVPWPPPRHVALLDAGAYGYTMASQYNGRAMPAEIFLQGGTVVAYKARRPPEEWVAERLAVGAS